MPLLCKMRKEQFFDVEKRKQNEKQVRVELESWKCDKNFIDICPNGTKKKPFSDTKQQSLEI